MNERIKELWDQAAKLEPDPSWQGQTKFMEKFAELIVCECADLADTAEPFQTSDLILKHFGVRQ